MARMRGCLWLTAGLVVALLAAVIAFITIQKYAKITPGPSPAGSTVSVVVAAKAVTVRSQLTAEDVVQKELPVQAVPEGAVGDTAAAVGKLTTVDLYPGEVILSQRLVDPNVTSGNGRLALIVAGDQVLMAYPAEDLMSKVGILKPGDHVDLLFTLKFPQTTVVQSQSGQGGTTSVAETTTTQTSEQNMTFSLLQNLTIAALVGGTGSTQGGSPQAILLTVSPQDALALKYAKDNGGILDIVLRAPGTENPFESEPVDVNYMVDRYRIPGR